jgi:hypothetical protein
MRKKRAMNKLVKAAWLLDKIIDSDLWEYDKHARMVLKEASRILWRRADELGDKK